MRLWILAAPLALSIYACSSDPADPTVETTDGGSEASTNDAGGTPDTSTPIVDAGSDSPAQTDGSASCTAATATADPPTETCTPLGNCPSCSDAGTRYLCQAKPFGAPIALLTSDAGLLSAGPLVGCQRLRHAPADNVAEYCCADAWVRRHIDIYDVRTCPVAKPHAYVAPALPNGTSRVPLPADCDLSSTPAGSPFAHACCPDML